MPRAEIRYSPAALNDLDEIWDHIALSLGNLQAAEHAVGAIISAISRLSIFPDSGSPLAALYPKTPGTGMWSQAIILRFIVTWAAVSTSIAFFIPAATGLKGFSTASACCADAFDEVYVPDVV